MKVLLSTYACLPEGGSEFGVGWDSVCAIAEYHDVVVLTRTVYRAAIEAELKRSPRSNLQFFYFDLPDYLQQFGFGDPDKPTQFYYVLWQRGARRIAQEIISKNNISIIHHVTYVKYWAPSFLSTLPPPFVWGPVGGGEVAPLSFWKGFSLRGKVYEFLRDTARFIQEQNPSVRRTAQSAAFAMATSEETARRISLLGAKKVAVYPAIGLSDSEITMLHQIKAPDPSVFRFFSVGRLLHWKGFHLGIAAFAKAKIPNAEYCIVGDGPEQKRLSALAVRLGVADKVRFWGRLPREKTLQLFAKADVLVHPSLHESGGGVCLEAMAAQRPVICLDLGGPGMLVSDEAGIRVEASEPVATVQGLADAMTALALDRDRCRRMGEAGHRLVVKHYLWRNKARHYSTLYKRILEDGTPGPESGGWHSDTCRDY